MTIKYLSKEKILEVLGFAADTGNISQYLIIKLLSNTGIRVSELIAISVHDILYEQRQLIIRGKGDKIRNVDISSQLVSFLKEFIKIKKLKNKDKLIPLSRQRIYQITQELAGVNPHIFRHSYAIHLLRKTKNIRYVQLQLGHSTIVSTQPYLRYMDFEEEKKKLDELYHSEG